METVDDCPCARLNPDYPYEGFMTKHMCVLKQKMKGVCEQETSKGCFLFYHMKVDEPVPMNSAAYRSKRIGSEYSYTRTFEVSITYNFYWPRYRAPSRNTTVRYIEIGALEEIP